MATKVPDWNGLYPKTKHYVQPRYEILHYLSIQKKNTKYKQLSFLNQSNHSWQDGNHNCINEHSDASWITSIIISPILSPTTSSNAAVPKRHVLHLGGWGVIGQPAGMSIETLYTYLLVGLRTFMTPLTGSSAAALAKHRIALWKCKIQLVKLFMDILFDIVAWRILHMVLNPPPPPYRIS